MRIWDLPPAVLCRAHLLGEHSELHSLWSVLTKGKRGFSRHPETLRWQGKLAALYARHEALVTEMTARGYKHASPLDESLATGDATQTEYVDPPERQVELLVERDCECRIEQARAALL